MHDAVAKAVNTVHQSLLGCLSEYTWASAAQPMVLLQVLSMKVCLLVLLWPQGSITHPHGFTSTGKPSSSCQQH